MAWCVLLVLGISGCDYWPPALQVQIEQLQSEMRTVTAENTHLQSQITELSAAKQDLQWQFDELNRVNREKSQVIATLHRQLDSLRARTVKAGTARAKKTATSTANSSIKQTVKKKPAAKR